jgi:hypothetical protein
MRFSDDASKVRLKRLLAASAVITVPLMIVIAFNALMTTGMPLPEKAWRVSTMLFTAGLVAWACWRLWRRAP